MSSKDHSLPETPIRDAASVIVIRDSQSPDPRVLMGQRGAKAAFMPNKFVFPGGAVDPEDAGVPLASPLGQTCQEQLTEQSSATLTHPLAVAAIRELWEETGLRLGVSGHWEQTTPESAAQLPTPPDGWESFARTGLVPSAQALTFVFRAITPPGRPRRFDARFFLVDAVELSGELDDFSHASDELSHLQWIPLSRARSFDLPFITEVVLAEVAARLKANTPPKSVPFFRNDDESSLFLRLYGRAPDHKDLGA